MEKNVRRSVYLVLPTDPVFGDEIGLFVMFPLILDVVGDHLFVAPHDVTPRWGDMVLASCVPPG
jgi:hypothetical protein